MKRNFIAKRFQSAGTGLTLDTAALAKYKDIVDLSIGDTDFTTDEAIINAAFRDAKAGHTHYGDPKGDPELISAVCKAWEEDFDQSLPRDHVLVSASSCLGMSLAMFAILDPGANPEAEHRPADMGKGGHQPAGIYRKQKECQYRGQQHSDDLKGLTAEKVVHAVSFLFGSLPSR